MGKASEVLGQTTHLVLFPLVTVAIALAKERVATDLAAGLLGLRLGAGHEDLLSCGGIATRVSSWSCLLGSVFECRMNILIQNLQKIVNKSPVFFSTSRRET